jgi:hypothetical protein
MKADALPPDADASLDAFLRIPPWVPKTVALAARQAYAVVNGKPRMIEYLVRLVSDERMRGVWHELGRRHRDGTFMHPAASAPAYAPISATAYVTPGYVTPASSVSVTADEWQDEAMASLLRAALDYAVNRGTTLTRQRAKQDRLHYLKMAQQLRADASRLWVDPERMRDRDRRRLLMSAAGAYTRAAARIANQLESGARKWYSPVIRERDRGKPADQWLALNIATECRWRFGSPHYSVTAIIVSVILDREIDRRAVRQWCSYPADKRR